MNHYFKRALLIILLFCISVNFVFSQPIRIGSKPFTEGYILSEIIAQHLESRGFEVERKFGLGGTLVCYQALVNGEIDLYPEYSGTIQQAILNLPEQISFSGLQALLSEKYNLELLESFGFNNTYALTTRAEFASKNNYTKISDLSQNPDLRFGLSYEFIERGDGWRALSRHYKLTATPIGMEHSLSYPALEQGKIDVMDVYSTDAEITKYDLVLLEDDKNFFPVYLAAPLVSKNLPVEVKNAIEELANTIDESEMQHLNSEAAVAGKSFAEIARKFLIGKKLARKDTEVVVNNKWQILLDKTLRHILLTAIALLAATLIAIPTGLYVYRHPKISGPVIYITGLMQTIPSLALLALMIPLFGIGVVPALVALFLYALLPILRNTFTALNSIDPVLKKVALGMGLTTMQQLRHIEIPLGIPTIMAGIRTAAVILIGTATIAAFIGAGGLGEYIVTGLSLNDPILIMWGAIPAALLAIFTELLFEWLERMLVPKHLGRK